jgi:Carboxypeptidase regulatory-like domain
MRAVLRGEFSGFNLAPTTRRDSNKQPVARFALLLLFLAAGVSLPLSLAQNIGQAVRVVQGRVQTTDDQPQPNAVVYLQDQKTLEVRTYITEADGHYRFGQLSSEVDYQLWAEYKGHKSRTKSISSFDSKKQFNFDLRIEAPK